MILNKKLKYFLIDGLFGILFLLVYEILILFFSTKLDLFTLILGWLPFYLFFLITKNLVFVLISTIFLFFIIGGLIGFLIRKIRVKN